MYGWRARIGLIVPANNTVIEPEFYRVAPSGVSIHTTRMMTEGSFTAEALIRMEKNAWRGVEELAAAGVDIIAYACLATSLAKGAEWSDKFIADIEKRTGLPATTASTATMDALRGRGVERVAVGTPYPENINDLLQPFLESHGFTVVSLRSLNIKGLLEVCRKPPEVAYRLGREVDVKEAEGVCLLGTDFRTMEVIEALEKDLDKPVITTNQALLWKTLILAGVRLTIGGYGTLLRQL